MKKIKNPMAISAKTARASVVPAKKGKGSYNKKKQRQLRWG